MATRSEVFSDLGTKFVDWLKKQGPGETFVAAPHYRNNLAVIGKPVQPHTSPTGKWFGLYEVLTGDRPKVDVFAVKSIAEFAAQYGKVASFFAIERKPEQVREQIRPLYPNCAIFDEVFDFAYTSERGDGGHTRKGYEKYCQFLCELEAMVSDGVRVALYTEIDEPYQRIIYGAPGTGKSHKVDEMVKKLPKEDVVRTTFHPDSDYSTFVGAYKPTMKSEARTLMKGEEIAKVTKGDASLFCERKISYSFVPQAFAKAYVQAWKRLAECKPLKKFVPTKTPTGIDSVMKDVVDALIAEHGGNVGFEVEKDAIAAKFAMVPGGAEYAPGSIIPSDYCYNRINDGIAEDKPTYFEYLTNGVYKCWGSDYKYCGPVLHKATGSANEEIVGHCIDGIRNVGGVPPVMLVIEEINRGDCAKVFGDLFQLLDRWVKDDEHDATKKAGFSEYPVLADSDLAEFIRGELSGVKAAIEGLGYASVVADDKLELMLPPNMYIWATMNTSDQSLFPMDSAFKRRWEWKYVPIAKPDEPNWKDRKIKVGSSLYDWWDFLTIINKHIDKATGSEDKQLGYFFVKAPDDTGLITAEQFADKVLFYLYGDVFKSYELPAAAFKREGGAVWAFRDFFYPETVVVLKADGQLVKDGNGNIAKTVTDETTQALKKPGDVNEFELAAFLDHLKWKDEKGEKAVGKSSIAGADA